LDCLLTLTRTINELLRDLLGSIEDQQMMLHVSFFELPKAFLDF
jgi:hypothetical protein